MPKHTDKKHSESERDTLIDQVLRVCKTNSVKDLSRKSGLSEQTLRNWSRPVEEGGTIAPLAHSLNKALSCVGYHLVIRDQAERTWIEPKLLALPPPKRSAARRKKRRA